LKNWEREPSIASRAKVWILWCIRSFCHDVIVRSSSISLLLLLLLLRRIASWLRREVYVVRRGSIPLSIRDLRHSAEKWMKGKNEFTLLLVVGGCRVCVCVCVYLVFEFRIQIKTIQWKGLNTPNHTIQLPIFILFFCKLN
jgi:hypothetical protein